MGKRFFILTAFLLLMVAQGYGQNQESMAFVFNETGLFFLYARPDLTNTSSARQELLALAKKEGWPIHYLRFIPWQEGWVAEIKLKRSSANLLKFPRRYSFHPHFWTRQPSITLEVNLKKPIDVRMEPVPSEIPVAGGPVSEEMTYRVYTFSQPVQIDFTFSVPSFSRYVFRILFGFLLPPFLSFASAFFLRRSTHPLLGFYYRITLVWTGLLFFIAYHLMSREYLEYFAVFYLDHFSLLLLSVVLFLAFLGIRFPAYFLLKKWRDPSLLFHVYLYSLCRTYFLIILPLWVYLIGSLWIPSEIGKWALLIGIGVVAFIFSPYLFVILFRGMRIQDIELIQRVRETAEKIQFPLPNLFSYAGFFGAHPNAFVVGWFKPFRFLFFSQSLLHNLTPEQVKAVVAHELAHWKKWHPFLLGIAMIFLVSVALTILEFTPHQYHEFLVFLFFFIGAYLFFALSRNFERQADKFAFRYYDGTFIESLQKISSLLPEEKTLFLHTLQTHPSLQERINWLKKLQMTTEPVVPSQTPDENPPVVKLPPEEKSDTEMKTWKV